MLQNVGHMYHFSSWSWSCALNNYKITPPNTHTYTPQTPTQTPTPHPPHTPHRSPTHPTHTHTHTHTHSHQHTYQNKKKKSRQNKLKMIDTFEFKISLILFEETCTLFNLLKVWIALLSINDLKKCKGPNMLCAQWSDINVFIIFWENILILMCVSVIH